ncbi:hypothetical protein H2200_002816 [Cladophialophora chaetospira]|uniref:Uncharacterized protein n=1 Tax=Cladophialophora chaetospira TaxID=386627 RepID=A0AA39CLP9_9EURO|nr:hypothetical protein H2200_002816 [Cladophialophora chaetospira]
MSEEPKSALHRPSELETSGHVFLKPVLPSLYVGAATGACGAAYGNIAGTLIQTSSPLAYTSLAATQWFTAGSTFFYCRSVLLSGPLSRDSGLHKVAASGIAGSCSGAVASAFLPRGSLVTGSIMLGVAAALSQAGLNTMEGSTPFSGMASGITSRIAALSPMKSLSDKEYEDLLRDKLLKVDVEIAVLDDQIADLRAAHEQYSQKGASRTRPG